MPKPIEATVLRSWDGVVITAWWDSGEELRPEPKEKWLNVRMFRSMEQMSGAAEKTIRLSPKEADKLVDLIQTRGNNAS